MGKKKFLTKRRKYMLLKKIRPLAKIFPITLTAIAMFYLLYQVFLLANIARLF